MKLYLVFNPEYYFAFESYMHPEFISVSEFEMSTKEDFLTQMKDWFDYETFDLGMQI